jgi:hypothetical protein
MDDQVVQAAVAWVLTTVFIRYCEDNGLVDERWISGPTGAGGENHLERAWAHRDSYFDAYPAHSDVEYLQAAVRTFGAIPAARDLAAEDRNPIWRMPVSGDGAKLLLDIWREQDSEGALLRDFRTDDVGDTRFLGDLYQDLSDHAKKRFALLQTPDFVEEFILDHTLEPALETFGLEGFRLIDPTCGSGHFLLGAFRRLLNHHESLAPPGVPKLDLVKKSLESLYGIDLNPFAIAISRFRLLLAATVACERKRLKDVPAFALNLAVGHSLLMGAPPRTQGAQLNAFVEAGMMEYAPTWTASGDYQQALRILMQKYHAVVGNPPYIAVKDAAEREETKKIYSSCFKKWTLSVPFTERFFDLALSGDRHGSPAGFIGLINSNNFTKREFGKALIEQVLPRLDLSHVLDTSGCYIPGHGTPTVILFGRNRQPNPHQPVRAVLGIRGEPGRPENAAQGQVWRTLVENLGSPGAETAWLSVADVERNSFHRHPWSLGGGNMNELLLAVANTPTIVSSLIADIGRTAHTGEDSIYAMPPHAALRISHDANRFLPLIEGDQPRDWFCKDDELLAFPYSLSSLQPNLKENEALFRHFWSYRTFLSARQDFGETILERGYQWYEWGMFFPERLKGRFGITFGEVATHNHFVLCRGGVVFKQTAPVIKLQPDASEEDHLRLMSCLNSSALAFWLRQVCMNKGYGANSEGGRVTSEAYENFYAFNSTNIQKAPIAVAYSEQRLAIAKRLDALGQELSRLRPGQLFHSEAPTQEGIKHGAARTVAIRSEMIFLQEELDWLCYRAYGILESAPLANPEQGVPLALGERAFEIHLARALAAGEEVTTWFERHRSRPITEIPAHWPQEYQAVVLQRLELIENHPYIALLEKPEHKRRWQSERWEDQVSKALRNWLCDQMESDTLWPRSEAGLEPRLQSARAIADRAFADPAFAVAADLYRGNDTYDRHALVCELLEGEAAPFVAAWRYTDQGLRKRADWEQTWELQRREDQGVEIDNIPVPPRYEQKDFQSAVYWRHRGKLDVPKERFIGYPRAERDDEASPVFLWAGYDHLGQAQALVSHIQEAREKFGWSAERLLPLLSGLDELLPWLKQWHNDIDPVYGVRLGDTFEEFLLGECQSLDLPRTRLKEWRPQVETRVRRDQGARGRRKQSA